MRDHHRKALSYILTIGLSVPLFLTVAQGFSGVGLHSTKEMRKPITASTNSEKSGILAWLASLLPDGIRLAGPSVVLKDSGEVLATANCFNSGAGISCNGFRSLEEYVAAVRVSENVGIPIHELRDRMLRGKTLSQAVQELRPGVSGQIEAMRAQQQAKKILRDFSS